MISDSISMRSPCRSTAGDLLVDRVGAEEVAALGGHDVLFDVLVGEAFLRKGDAAPLPERAYPEVQQHQITGVLLSCHC
jgi:hypothetical protein